VIPPVGYAEGKQKVVFRVKRVDVKSLPSAFPNSTDHFPIKMSKGRVSIEKRPIYFARFCNQMHKSIRLILSILN